MTAGPVLRRTFRVPVEVSIDVPGTPGTREFDFAESDAYAAVRGVPAALTSDDDAVTPHAVQVDLPRPTEPHIRPHRRGDTGVRRRPAARPLAGRTAHTRCVALSLSGGRATLHPGAQPSSTV